MKYVQKERECVGGGGVIENEMGGESQEEGRKCQGTVYVYVCV